MNTILANAFSLNMVGSFPAKIDVKEVSVGYVRFALTKTFVSAIGHADTAGQLSNLLCSQIPFARSTVKLTVGDELIVAQFNGPRLPEGTTVLPEGATFKFFHVVIS